MYESKILTIINFMISKQAKPLGSVGKIGSTRFRKQQIFMLVFNVSNAVSKINEAKSFDFGARRASD